MEWKGLIKYLFEQWRAKPFSEDTNKELFSAIWTNIFRSQSSQMFFEKGALKNFTIFKNIIFYSIIF